jgi:hypothetical protein
MSLFVTSSRLQPGQVAQAYPLARSLIPTLEPAEWERLARPLVGAGDAEDRGILAARNTAGYLCGLCFYAVERGPAGARLLADHFVAFDVTDRAPVAAALLEAVDARAADLGCTAIHTCIAASQQRLLDRFRRSGYAAQSVLLCKSLEAAPPAGTCVKECLGHWPSSGEAAAVERSARPG